MLSQQQMSPGSIYVYNGDGEGLIEIGHMNSKPTRKYSWKEEGILARLRDETKEFIGNRLKI